MKGKSPKEFARMQVYGQNSSNKKFAKNHSNKSVSSVTNSGHLIADDGSRVNHLQHPLQGNSVQSVGKYDSQMDLAPSKFTKRSEALMKELQETGKIGKFDERIQSCPDKKMLLSEDKMFQFEKENRRKGETKEDIIKKEKELLDRIYYDQSSSVEKELLRQKQQEKQMSQCTFSPRLIHSQFQSLCDGSGSQYLSKREPTFFEQSQKMQSVYDHHREVLKDAQENEQKQDILEKPGLSKKSKKIGEIALEKRGLKDVNVVDRLYHEKKQIEVPKDPNSYQPQISYLPSSKPRELKIDEYLYQDAKRRKEEERRAYTSPNSGSQSIQQTSTQKKNQQKAVVSRFDKEFQNAVANMAFTKDPHLRKLPETISYLDSIEILKTLKFIGQRSHEDNYEISTQVQRIWNQLSSNPDKQRVLTRNLEVFLFAVQNIRADESIVPFVTSQQLQSEQNPINQKSNQLNPDNSSPRSRQLDQAINKFQISAEDKKPIGSFDYIDNLSYTPQQVQYIHKQFKDLGNNKLAGDKKSFTNKVVEDVPTFAPAISDNSRRLAQERRFGQIQDLKSNEGFDGSPLDLNEILVYQQQLTRYQNEELRSKLEDEKMNLCTFHPKTIDFSKVEKYFSPNFQPNNFEEEMQGRAPERKGATSTKPLGVHRTIELYSLSKPQNQRRDRDKGDIEYERECDECTFAPDISHIKLEKANASMSSQLHSISNPNKSKLLPQQQKGIQKSIERMKSGRERSKITEYLSEHGTTFSSKKRENQENVVKINLSKEKHIHNRPQGRFISQNSHGHSHNNPRRVIQSSPKPPLLSPQETNDYNHSGEDSSRNAKPPIDPQEGEEYFLKPPPGQDKEKPPQQGATSKTLEEDRVPLLFVDVNIEDGKTARIIVYEGEKSEDLANKFAQEHNLDVVMTGRLKDLLDQQINSLLTKIDEEVGSDHDDEEEESGEDEQGNFHHRRHKKPELVNTHQDSTSNHHSNQDINQPHQDNNNHSHFSDENQEYIDEQNPQPIVYSPPIGTPSVGMRGEGDAKPIQHSGSNASQIENMHMQALAATFKNYVQDDEKRKQLPPSDGGQDSFSYVIPKATNTPGQISNNYGNNLGYGGNYGSGQSNSYQVNTYLNNQVGQNSGAGGIYQQQSAQGNLSSQQYSQTSVNQYQPQSYGQGNVGKSQKDIEEMHMRALAITAKNFSENENKFNQ